MIFPGSKTWGDGERLFHASRPGAPPDDLISQLWRHFGWNETKMYEVKGPMGYLFDHGRFRWVSHCDQDRSWRSQAIWSLGGLVPTDPHLFGSGLSIIWSLDKPNMDYLPIKTRVWYQIHSFCGHMPSREGRLIQAPTWVLLFYLLPQKPRHGGVHFGQQWGALSFVSAGDNLAC